MHPRDTAGRVGAVIQISYALSSFLDRRGQAISQNGIPARIYLSHGKDTDRRVDFLMGHDHKLASVVLVI